MSVPRTGTRPENLGSSQKRSRGPNLYLDLLPLTPSKPSFLASFLSATGSLAPLSPPQIQAIYDDLTRSVWVRGEQDMVLLWRRGFFGKGAMSRSEPSWKRRVMNMRAELEGRQQQLTSEELTAQRRIVRKSTKQVKKLEREAEKLAEAKLQASQRGGSSSVGSPAPSTSEAQLEAALATDEDFLEQILEEEDELELENDEEVDADADADGDDGEADAVAEEDLVDREQDDDPEEPSPPPPLWQLDVEHTQLQPEEAFFLLFALGVLTLRQQSPFLPSGPTTPSTHLSILSSWKLFLLHGATPSLSSPTAGLDLNGPDPRLARLDSPFLISYAVYHHFRSMGWVVRSGIKFCTEWVLYGPGGPVGGHAEFAVIVIPNYADPKDEESNPFKSGLNNGMLAEGENKNSWRWFNTVNRVCSGAKKTLLLLHVLIPPMSTLPSPNFVSENPAQAMAMLEMREVTVRRWMAGRSRD